MSFYCPVCNGLQNLYVPCPNCGGQAADYGRSDDYLGPYSPYRPIDDLKMTNGYPDLQQNECVHVLYCTECGHSFLQSVQEWNG